MDNHLISHGDTVSHTFGSFMRLKREEKGISLRSFAKELEITAAYLSDVENGNRPAPKSRLNTICDKLCLTQEDRDTFFDLAALTCGNHYEDINPYLTQNEAARIALRKARDAGLSDSWWQEIVSKIDEITAKE